MSATDYSECPKCKIRIDEINSILKDDTITVRYHRQLEQELSEIKGYFFAEYYECYIKDGFFNFYYHGTCQKCGYKYESPVLKEKIEL